MKFFISTTSDYDYPPSKAPAAGAYKDKAGCWCVDIDGLAELMELQEEVKHSLIVGQNSIEIYDGWRE